MASVNLSNAKSIYYKNKKISRIELNNETIWSSVSSIKYPCDLTNINLKVLDVDSPLFNEDLAMATWFIHRNVLWFLIYRYANNPAELNNIRTAWAYRSKPVVIQNLLVDSEYLSNAMMGLNGFGGWFFTSYPGTLNGVKGNGELAQKVKPHPKIVNYLNWINKTSSSENEKVGISTMTKLHPGVSYRLLFWYRITPKENIKHTFDIYPGVNSIPGSNLPSSTIVRETRHEGEVIRINEDKLIIDGNWHICNCTFRTKTPTNSFQEEQTILTILGSANNNFSIAGPCLKYIEQDNEIYDSQIGIGGNKALILKPDINNFLSQVMDKSFFLEHGLKIWQICSYKGPSSEKPMVLRTELQRKVEKYMAKLDVQLPRITKWYTGLNRKNITSRWKSWRSVLNEKFKYTWNFKEDNEKKDYKGMGPIMYYDGCNPLPKGVNIVLYDLKWNSLKESSPDYSIVYNELSELNYNINGYYNNNFWGPPCEIIIRIKPENLVPREWMIEEKKQKYSSGCIRYVYTHENNKSKEVPYPDFSVAKVREAYTIWVNNIRNYIQNYSNISQYILGIFGRNGSWDNIDGYNVDRPYTQSELESFLRPWLESDNIRKKIILPKRINYLYYSNDIKKYYNPYFGKKDYTIFNRRFDEKTNELENGGPDGNGVLGHNYNLIGVTQEGFKYGSTRGDFLLALTWDNNSTEEMLKNPEELEKMAKKIKEKCYMAFGPFTREQFIKYGKEIESLKTYPVPKLKITEVSVKTLRPGNADMQPKLEWKIKLKNIGDLPTYIQEIGISKTDITQSNQTYSYLGKLINSIFENYKFLINPNTEKEFTITTESLFPITEGEVYTLKIVGVDSTSSNSLEDFGEGQGMPEERSTTYRSNNSLEIPFSGPLANKELDACLSYSYGIPLYLHEAKKEELNE